MKQPIGAMQSVGMWINLGYLGYNDNVSLLILHRHGLEQDRGLFLRAGMMALFHNLRRMQNLSFVSSLPSLWCCPHPDGSRWAITIPISHAAERREVEMRICLFPLRTRPRRFTHYFCAYPLGSAVFCWAVINAQWSIRASVTLRK